MARRATLLTNSEYFKALAESLRLARRRIVVIGWDFDAALCLDPVETGGPCQPLHDFFGDLLDRRPALEIYVLLWDRTIFYGGNRRASGAFKLLAERHSRFKFCFAPADFAASHHAKLVAIDDALAFVGGIDLAGDRWDRTGHPPTNPRRVTPEGEAYGPIHDLQMMVDGPVAADLGLYARSCWIERAGTPLPALESERSDLWPPGYEADFTDMRVGIARTDPAGISEVEALNIDALSGARHAIYIEAQYLTATAIGELLARRLEEPDGPEIVIVVTRTSHGHVEQFAMGSNRDRLLRRLAAADRHGRLRVYYPVSRDATECVEVKIHTKLIMADDRFLRVGSSNLNNRSLAIDTECDLAFVPTTASQRATMRAIRARLLADQLHQPVAAVIAACDATNSLIGAIEALNGEGFLQKLPALDEPGPDTPLPGTILLDPEAPLTVERLWSEIGAGVASLLDLGDAENQPAEGERD